MAEAQNEEQATFDPFLGGDNDDMDDLGSDLSPEDYGDLIGEVETSDAPMDQMANEQQGLAAGVDTREEPEAAAEEPEAVAEEAVAEEEPGAVAEEGEEPEAAAEEPDAPGPMIPKARLDREVRTRRAAEARAAELERRLNSQAPQKEQAGAAQPEAEAPQVPMDTSEMFNAVLNGDVEKANETFKSIIEGVVGQTVQSTMQKAEALVNDRVTGTLQESQARSARDSALQEIVEAHPVFDPGAGEVYDQGLVDEVLALEAGFVARDYAPGDALKQAVEYAMTVHRPDLLQKSDPAPTKGATQQSAAQDRKRTAQIRGAQAASRQPPDARGSSGPDIEEIDIDSLTDAQFDALPQETKARLRGDIL